MNNRSEKSSGHITVPSSYIGVWRRDMLSSAAGEDTTTRVLWMQTDHLFIDLRVPANRPDFSSVASLDDCSNAQLDWLAGQQGFAGWLDVEGDRFQWQRVLDFQPDRTVQDIGRMSVRDDYVLEEGILADYYEHWRKITPDEPAHRAYRLARATDANDAVLPWRGYLLMVGDFFMMALDRRGGLPQSTSLRELAQGDRRWLLQVLDIELSFGLLHGSEGGCEITLSTHPFREGVTLFTSEPKPDAQGQLVQMDRGYSLQWGPAADSGITA